jgi:hypothetical protein
MPARLRHRFFSLNELDRACCTLLADLNQRPLKRLPGCRASAFAERVRPACARCRNAATNMPATGRTDLLLLGLSGNMPFAEDFEALLHGGLAALNMGEKPTTAARNSGDDDLQAQRVMSASALASPA